MAIDIAELERLIREGIPDAQVSIEDLRGDGDHYAATVVSPAAVTSSRARARASAGCPRSTNLPMPMPYDEMLRQQLILPDTG